MLGLGKCDNRHIVYEQNTTVQKQNKNKMLCLKNILLLIVNFGW